LNGKIVGTGAAADAPAALMVHMKHRRFVVPSCTPCFPTDPISFPPFLHLVLIFLLFVSFLFFPGGVLPLLVERYLFGNAGEGMQRALQAQRLRLPRTVAPVRFVCCVVLRSFCPLV
jgi:tRNase Z endonuclease